MTHSLDQKVVTRQAKARNCAAEIVGNVHGQAKIQRQPRLMIFFLSSHRRQEQRYTRYVLDKSSRFCWNGEPHVVPNC